MRTFVLVIVLMGLISIAQMWPTPPYQIVGTITGVEPGHWIRIKSDMTDFDGIRVWLQQSTKIDGDPRGLRRDAYVRVFYASTGGEAVARRVTILTK